jgi:aryl-alcohol dehydrogenase-like predicted oxidoreductase
LQPHRIDEGVFAIVSRGRKKCETTRISSTSLQFSLIGLGTWAMGGSMWGGTDEQESIRTIHSAIDRGITLIDTAPV